MIDLSNRLALPAALALGAVGIVGSTVLTSGPALAAPNLPKGVRVQCSGFSGPNTTFPHFLTGCTTRNGDVALGQTEKLNGIETIIWYLPFLNGRTMQLVNITNQLVNPPSGQCPADHPAEFNVSGSIKVHAVGGIRGDGDHLRQRHGLRPEIRHLLCHFKEQE
jgi:hypothetical protein